MKPSPESEQNLERFVATVLRELPARRAPRSLSARVLAELERRAALPWWRQSFVHWPIVARGAFVAASVALAITLVWALAGLNVAQAAHTFAANLAWLDTARGVVAGTANLGAIVFRGLSPAWIYGGAVAFVGLYAALFGLGTAAYRTLYANR